MQPPNPTSAAAAGIFFSLRLWLATVRIGTTLPAPLEYQQSRRQQHQHHHHHHLASSLSEDGVSSEAARNLQQTPPLAPPLLPPPPQPHPCCSTSCLPRQLLVVMVMTNGERPDYGGGETFGPSWRGVNLSGCALRCWWSHLLWTLGL